MSTIDSSLTVVWRDGKAKFGIIKNKMLAASVNDVQYVRTKCFYKTPGGSITLSQGNTVVQPSNGLSFLDVFIVNETLRIEAAESNTVTYLIVESVIPALFNIEVVDVAGTYSINTSKYAALVEGNITVNNSLPDNVTLYSGNDSIALSVGDTLFDSTSDPPTLLKINNNTTVTGNGKLLIFNEVQ